MGEASALVSRKYAQDYRLENVLDERGRIKTVPVYRGTRYRPALSGVAWQHFLRALAVYSLSAIVCVLVPLFLNTPLLRHMTVLMPLALSLYPLFRLLRAWLSLSRRQQAITRQDKDRLQADIALGSGLLLFLLAFSLLSQIVWLIQGQLIPSDAPVPLCTALGAGCAARIWLRLRKTLTWEPE